MRGWDTFGMYLSATQQHDNNFVANTLHATWRSSALHTLYWHKIKTNKVRLGWCQHGWLQLSASNACCSDSADRLDRREDMPWVIRHGQHASRMQLGHVVVIAEWVGNLSTLADVVI